MLLVLPTAVEVGEEIVCPEPARIDGQQLEVIANRRRLHVAVPALEVLAPELALERGRARRQASLNVRVSLRLLPPRAADDRQPRAGRRPAGGGSRRSRLRRPSRYSSSDPYRRSPSLKPAIICSGKSSAWKRVTGRVKWVGSRNPNTRPGRGEGLFGHDRPYLFLFRDVSDAVRIAVELVHEHAHGLGGGFACLDPVETPLLAHRAHAGAHGEQVEVMIARSRSFARARP